MTSMTTPVNHHHHHHHSNSSSRSSLPGGSSSSHHGEVSTPFFADAVLDLDEAHDIAETPEAATLSTTSLQNHHHHHSSFLPQQQQQQQPPPPDLEGHDFLHVPNLSSSNSRSRAGQATTTTPTTAAAAAARNTNHQNHNSLSPQQQQQPQPHTNPMNCSTKNDEAPPPVVKTRFSRISFDMERRDTRPATPPRWPRDIPWAVAFWLFTPVALLYPLVTAPNTSTSTSSSDSASSTPSSSTSAHPLGSHPLSTASLHAVWWAAVATFLLSRILYRSMAGGDGEDARHQAAQLLTISAPLSVGASLALTFFLWWACPTARWAVLVPLWYTIRDLYLFRRWKRRHEAFVTTTSLTPDTNTSTTTSTANTVQYVRHNNNEAGTSSRQAFFQALTDMALDILSRSLRRSSFYRVLSVLLLVQLWVLLLWRWAILAALAKLGTNYPASNNHHALIALILALVAGKWATGLVARLLTLLACGGVTSWFMEQSALLRDMPEARIHPQWNNSAGSGDSGNGINHSREPDGAVTENHSNMPEAYRAVDASVYQPVLTLDDALDDDYDDEDDDEFLEAPRRDFGFRDHNHPHSVSATTPANVSTVKSILSAGLTVSFGSVALCGLLGGPAQFVWSQVRKVEAAQSVIIYARNTYATNGRSANNGFRGMPIGNDTSLSSKLLRYVNQLARSFVRRYSDLAMTHVAGYYKNYQRAARDVAALIDESGTCLEDSNTEDLFV